MEAVEYAGLKSTITRNGWTVLGISRVVVVVFVTVPLFLTQAAVLKLMPTRWWHVVGFWHRAMCRVIGVEIVEHGNRREDGPVLFVANHMSWLDILILGGRLRQACFVAKAELAGWGALGRMAKLHKTIFVNRERRTEAARQRDALVERVQEGHSLILFPEGSNTDGMRVAPFKSALFSVAERANEASNHRLVVQPVTIAFVEMNGIPMVRAQKPWVSWIGEVELISHLRHALGLGKIVATVEYHEPISADELGCRKDMARHCEKVVRRGVERALRHENRLGPQKGAI